MFDVNFEFEKRDEFNSSVEINTYPQKTSELINDLNFADINYVDTAVGKIIVPSKLSELDNDTGYITLEDIPSIDVSNMATKEDLNKKQDKISDLDAIRSGANKGATSVQPNDLSLVAKTGDYNDLFNKPIIPTKYGYSIVMSVDPTTYVGTLALKDQNGNTLGDVQTFDLPLESVVVGGSYDEVNKSVILTLKGGDTVSFSVADLVRGLQTEITDNNKLSANLVDDTNSSKKFVSENEKTLWNDKQDAISDLSTIRSNANLGATAVQPENIPVTDVQVNGASILNDGVANIPIAGNSRLGVVFSAGFGVIVTASGALAIIKATDALINAKANNFQPVVPSNLDYAVKVGVTTNTKELTTEEKASACNWLGAGHQRTTVIDSTTPTIVLDKALANTDYQYGTITSLSITEIENSYLETNIFFTAGSEITVDLPDTLKIIGNLSFEAEKQYAMSICNNTLIAGVIN